MRTIPNFRGKSRKLRSTDVPARGSDQGVRNRLRHRPGNLIVAVEVPANFQADLIAGRRTSVQVNVDATAIAQAGNGASYVKNVIADEVQKFLLGRERQGSADQFCHPGEVHCQPEDCLVLCHDAGHQPDHSFDGDLDKGRVDP
jgi:hypothetical protein